MSDDAPVGTMAWAQQQIDKEREAREAAAREYAERVASDDAEPVDEFGTPEEMRAEIVRLREEVNGLQTQLDELQSAVNRLYKGDRWDW